MKLRPLPPDPKRPYNPLAYRRDQVVESLKEYLDFIEDFLVKADELIEEGKLGEAKEALKKLNSASGASLSAIVYAQALDWANKHPHIVVERFDDHHHDDTDTAQDLKD